MKGVTKREVPAEPANNTLSDNISLFQSIRVLQDEEEPALRERSPLSKNLISPILHKIISKFARKRSYGNVRQDIGAFSSNCCMFNASLHPRRIVVRDLHQVATPQEREPLFRLSLRRPQRPDRLSKPNFKIKIII